MVELSDDEDEEDWSSSHEDGRSGGEKERPPDYLTRPVWDRCLRSSKRCNAAKIDPSKARLSLNLIIHKLSENVP